MRVIHAGGKYYQVNFGMKGLILLNQNPKVSRNIKKILNDFVAMQEDSLETLKKFL